MAEELGHIDIRFPGTPSGGAGDTTGPLPTKLKMPDFASIFRDAMSVLTKGKFPDIAKDIKDALKNIGGGGGEGDMGAIVVNLFKAASGDVLALAKVVVSAILAGVKAIIDIISSLMEFVENAVSELQERGKFSGEVLKETAAMKIQATQFQIQESQSLGNLYAVVIRWYRELMAALQPVKQALGAILALVAGAVLIGLKLIVGTINFVLAPIAKIITMIAAGIGAIADWFTSSESQNLYGGVGDASKITGFDLGLSDFAEVQSRISSGSSSAIVGGLADVADRIKDNNDQLRELNRKTSKGNTSLDWAGAELRGLAARSGLYGSGNATPLINPGYWNPPKSRYPKTPSITNP